MSFRQVHPALFRMSNRKIGIQISVRLLRALNQSNQFFRFFPQTVAFADFNAKSNCFQPFIRVGILENRTGMFPLQFTRRNPEILNAAGRLLIGQPSVQRFRLVRVRDRNMPAQCFPLKRQDRIRDH
ncbi:hypothetical protein SDC9_125418 [bioreactor metagenome]|uniref:Uncharacterized protein n=1 Tax=bioreactor metagenome TaxID=1076179 RepID=A0A645CNB5_9ZZZZ